MGPAEPAGGALPDPALVVLVGPSGSGKSFWAARRYRPDEVVSSGRMRSLAGPEDVLRLAPLAAAFT